MSYAVKLPEFEGPMDLLLHLVHKNELDIFDIPIAAITAEYLAYLDRLEAEQVEVAGDFLIMAAILVHLKSQLLLPDLMDGNAAEEPGVAFTVPLLEYMHARELAQALDVRPFLGRDVFARPNEGGPKAPEAEPEVEASLYQLMEAFRRLMATEDAASSFRFQPQRWSVKEKMALLRTQLVSRSPRLFSDLLLACSNAAERVVTFLALLELIHMGELCMFQPGPESDILINYDSTKRTGAALGAGTETHH